MASPSPVQGQGGAVSGSASSSPIPSQWQQPTSTSNGEIRSVTPAMNNTRGATMYPSRVNVSSPARTPGSESNANANTLQPSASGSGQPQSLSNSNSQYNANRTMSPQRYLAHNNSNNNINQKQQQQDSGPSSTGLIRLTLRKPMGIVFEPMYDPNQPSVQKGVRICDLPRTGAAALSRKLEIGDELLSINDKTMSRLTFDEIMDFIIEADPEQVNLLFRRPRKEVLAARNALKAPPPNKYNANSNAASVKWVDEDSKSPKRDKSKSKGAATTPVSSSSSKKKKTSSSKKERYDDDTLETYDEKPLPKKKGRRDPYESESFLDLLIDTICANPDAVCKPSDRHGDADYDSDEDEDDRTLTSYDDSTYVTYESEKEKKPSSSKDKGVKKLLPPTTDSETEDDTFAEEEERRRSKIMNNVKSLLPKPYEDDATLETTETTDRLPVKTITNPSPTPPLGLAAVREVQPAPQPEPPKQQLQAPPLQHHIHHHQQQQQLQQQQQQQVRMPQMMPAIDDEKNKAPITELEYDDQVDADVSVMESLGGPSLLIEQRRQHQTVVQPPKDVVPAEIVNEFGSDYPADFGYTREQTIGRDPVRFYSFVVKKLLEQHEPEKVRLLDKLLAKYKGREDHLVQKLSVRYRRAPDEGDVASFSEAVNKNKESETTERAVQKAQERAAATFGTWPEKETKEQEPVDVDKEESEEESEFSGDSIDGTSPAVIAQVSELLNYVYGKTSVPGQIDRVSTIMRAYEGREAVLLELLETKALIKANSEKENAANLPSFLRNSPALDQNREEDDMVSPLSSPNTGMNQQPVGGNIINDDISSMSGVSSPVPESGLKPEEALSKQKAAERAAGGNNGSKEPKRAIANNSSIPNNATLSSAANKEVAPSKQQDKDKKKKGLFGGLFNKKNRKGGGGALRSKGEEQGSI